MYCAKFDHILQNVKDQSYFRWSLVYCVGLVPEKNYDSIHSHQTIYTSIYVTTGPNKDLLVKIYFSLNNTYSVFIQTIFIFFLLFLIIFRACNWWPLKDSFQTGEHVCSSKNKKRKKKHFFLKILDNRMQIFAR